MVNPLQFNGAEIARDHQGYLKDLNDWQPDMALLLAAEEANHAYARPLGSD